MSGTKAMMMDNGYYNPQTEGKKMNKKQEKELATYEVHTLWFRNGRYFFHTFSDSNTVEIEYYKRGYKLPDRKGSVSKEDARLVYRELLSRGGKTQADSKAMGGSCA